MDKWPLLFMPADEFFVEFSRLVGKDAGDDLDPGFSQRFKAASGHKRIRVLDRADDARYAGVYQGCSAGWSLALMRMRLKRDIRRAAFRQMPRIFESDDLGVCDAVVNISALANDLAAR